MALSSCAKAARKWRDWASTSCWFISRMSRQTAGALAALAGFGTGLAYGNRDIGEFI